jgi:hypothetical protein
VNPVFQNPGKLGIAEIIERAKLAFFHVSKEDIGSIVVNKVPNSQDAELNVPKFHFSRHNLNGNTKEHGDHSRVYSIPR